MSERKLQISLKADIREGQKLQKFLNDLAASGNKVAKSMNEVAAGGSKTGQRGALAKALIHQKDIFKDLTKESTTFAEVLQKKVMKTTDEFVRKIDQTNQKLRTLSKVHRETNTQMSDLRSRHGDRLDSDPELRARADKLRRRLNTTEDAIQERLSDKSGFQSKLAKFGSADSASSAIGMFNAMMKAGGFMMGAGALLNTGGNIWEMAHMRPLANKATAAGFFGNTYRQVTGGDFSTVAALMLNSGQIKGIGNAAGTSASLHQGGGALIGAGKILAGVGGAAALTAATIGTGGLALPLAAAAGGVTALTAGGAAQDIAGSAIDFKKMGREAKTSTALQQAVGATIQSNPLFFSMLEDFQQNAGARGRQFRLFGGERAGRQALGAGAHFGMMQGESMALQEQLSGLMGATRGNQVFGEVAGAERFYGVSRGAAAAGLAGLSVGAGGDTSKAKKFWEDLMAKAFERGIKDSRLKDEIAQATASLAFGAGGRSSGDAAGMALMNAMGPGADLQTVRSTVGAMGGLNDFFSGKSGGGYFQASGLQAAGDVLKRTKGNFNAVDQMALGSVSFSDLLNGGNDQTRALGIGKDALGGMMHERFARLVQTAGTPELRSAFNSAGGDIKGFLSGMSKRDRAQLQTIMGPQGLGLAGDFDQAGQMLSLLEHMGEGGPSPAAKGKAKNTKAGSASEAFAVAQANATLDMFNRASTKENGEALIKVAAGATKLLEAAGKFGQEMTSDPSKVLVAVDEALKNLTETAEQFLKRLGPLMKSGEGRNKSRDKGTPHSISDVNQWKGTGPK